MIIEIDETILERWGPEQLRQVRPLLEELAVKLRRNLRLLDGLLGLGDEHPDLVREHAALCSEHHETLMRAEALEHSLATANAWISVLQSKVAAFEDEVERDTIYTTVGLDEAAHDVVVAAARRALLAHLHPDRARPEDKLRASARFAQASAAFDKILEFRRC